MKIIILCNSLSGGGAEKVAADTVSILKKQSNFSIQVASSDASADIVLKKSKGSNILRAFFNFSNMFLFFSALKKEKPNVIHIHNYLTELTVSVLLSIWIYKLIFNKEVRVVQTLHDHHITCPNSSLYDDNNKKKCMLCINGNKLNIIKNKCYQSSRFKSLFKYLRFECLKQLTRNFNIIDIFLCPSEFIRNILIRDGIPLKRTKIVRNPIQDVFFEASILEANNKHRAGSKINIIYLGRLVKIKSIETIIEAVKMCSILNINVTADICGSGDQKGTLEDLITKEGLSEKVFLRGKLNVSQVKKVASNSDILVLPSVVFENAPLVIYEAVSMGLFPIVSNFGGMEEAIQTIGFGNVFEAGNPQSLKDAIEKYILNKKNIGLAKSKAKTKVKNLCSEIKYKQALEYAYQHS